jgi:predicted Zn-dependent peptidase
MDTPTVKTVLPNGVRLVSQSMPHARSVAMGVWVNVGARDEADAESGLSHLIEHMIFKGTRRRSAYQIAKEFDAIGGHTNAFTTMETTCYHAKVLDRQVETMVDILADIFFNSVFDPGELDRERPVILQEIGMVEDSPDEYIHYLAGRNFWGEHPLGRSILGTPDTLTAFGSEDIRRFFRRLYQPERIVVAAAGRIEHERLVDLVGPAFAAAGPGNGFPERMPPTGRRLVAVHPRDLEQVHICLSVPGLPVTDPRRYALSLLNTLLGGNMSSRLFQEIRETRGLAYAVYSFTSAHVDTGMFGVYAAVAPENVLETIELIARELDRAAREPVDPAELAGAIEYTRGNLLLAAESADNQMVRAAQNEIHFGRELPLDAVLEAVAAVTSDDLQQLAGALFRPEGRVLSLLGPVDLPESQLEQRLFGA